MQPHKTVGHRDWGWIAAVLLPLAAIWPSISRGVLETGDGNLHVHRMFAMRTLLESGALYPRWVSYFHLGYGYPIFNFYAPGSYFAGAGLSFLDLDVPQAFNLLIALSWMIGSLGAYRLARVFLPGYAALLAACLWAYAPSRLYEVWSQGSLPQMIATAIFPWLFAGLLRAARQPGWRSLIGVALPYTIILFTHQPAALIASLGAGLFTLVCVGWSLRQGLTAAIMTGVRMAVGLLLGLGLSAIFTLPALAELPYVAAASGTDDMIAFLTQSFLQPSDLFRQPQPFDLTDVRRAIPATFGLLGGGLAAAGVIALAVRRRWLLALFLVSALALVSFMLIAPSLPVWTGVPLLAQLRFPERFLRLGVLPLMILGGAALLIMPRRWQPAACALAIGAVIITTLPLLVSQRAAVTWERLSAVDEILMEETDYIWGTTSYNEFNPIWGERIALDPPADRDRYRDEPLHINVQGVDCPTGIVERTDAAAYRIQAEMDCLIRFRQYYFPGWQATIDGQPADIAPEPDLGLIALRVPAGEHSVTLRYAGTAVQMSAALISLASAAALAGLWWLGRYPRSAPHVVSDAGFGQGAALAWAGGFMVTGLLVGLYVDPQTDWFRLRSAPDAPAYMETRVDADFGGLFTLLGYTLDAPSAAPGTEMRLTLYWRAQQPIDGFYRPIVQIIDPGVTAAWAVSQPFIPSAGETRGFTPDHFFSDVHRLRVFEDAPAAEVRLSVQMVEAASGSPLLLPEGRDRLVLDVAVRIVDR